MEAQERDPGDHVQSSSELHTRIGRFCWGVHPTGVAFSKIVTGDGCCPGWGDSVLLTAVGVPRQSAWVGVGRPHGVRKRGSFPVLSLKGWGIIVWLALVNTAFAFTLWNRTLQVLSAVESSIINNTMLIQIAVLAWVFLGESLGALEIVGLGLAALGTLLVQLRRPLPSEFVTPERFT